ncbi:MAG: LapA family protein [Patescibacteria group bacterium]
MLFFLVLGLLLGAVAVIFALQNLTTISIAFLGWNLEGSLALVLVLAMVAGVLISILVSIPEFIKTQMKLSALKKQNKRLEEEVLRLKDLVNPIVEQPVIERTVVTETTPVA